MSIARKQGGVTVSTIKVSIIEDHGIVRAGLRMLLDNQPGMEVVSETSSASEAMNSAQTIKPDVILLDLTLPGPPSHAIVTKAEQVQPGSKVILTSAYSEEKARAIIGVPQIHGFIRKPFQYGDLLQMLRNILAEKAAVYLA